MNPSHGNLTHKSDDELIDQVLTGIGKVEVPADLNQRLHEALRYRAATMPAHATLQPSTKFLASLRLWLTLAASLTAAALIFAFFHTKPTRHTTSTVATNHTLANIGTPNGIAPVQTATNALSTSEHLAHVSYPSVARPQKSPQQTDQGMQARSIAPQKSLDELAREETDAPSLPPPVRPLSEQERNLTRLLRRNNAVQIAELNPEIRAAEQANDDARFKALFPKPRRAPLNPQP